MFLDYLTNMNKRSDKQKAEYIEDAQKVFVYLCKVSGKDPARFLFKCENDSKLV